MDFVKRIMIPCIHKHKYIRRMKKIIKKLKLVQIVFIVSVLGFIGHVDDSPDVEILIWFMMTLMFGVWSILLMVDHR